MIASPKIIRAQTLIATAQYELDVIENLTVQLMDGVEEAAAESVILGIARAMDAIGKAVRVLDGDDSV